jgi:DNA-binding NarL/FixJ family response regulator
MLAEGGYQHVKSTTDSRQVIALYGELQPDLILLDLMMPHVDGIAVIQQLHIPEDVFPHLLKPFDLPEVRQLVHRMLIERGADPRPEGSPGLR